MIAPMRQGEHDGEYNGPELVALQPVDTWGMPPRLWRRAGDIREFEPASIIATLARRAGTILNVGPTWGRDYYALRTQGKRVFNLDIATQEGLPHTVCGDVTRPLPFANGTFDAIVAAEVLEHLVEDHLALLELRRVLADGGRLIVTVPFYHDEPVYHVRVHSPRSITRLLAATGFSAEVLICRAGFVRHPKVTHGMRKLLAPIGLSQVWYRLVVTADFWLGRQPWAARFAGGCYIVAHKSEEALDWRALNRDTYENR
jgi:SAM-dependent methyltransferase